MNEWVLVGIVVAIASTAFGAFWIILKDIETKLRAEISQGKLEAAKEVVRVETNHNHTYSQIANELRQIKEALIGSMEKSGFITRLDNHGGRMVELERMIKEIAQKKRGDS